MDSNIKTSTIVDINHFIYNIFSEVIDNIDKNNLLYKYPMFKADEEYLKDIVRHNYALLDIYKIMFLKNKAESDVNHKAFDLTLEKIMQDNNLNITDQFIKIVLPKEITEFKYEAAFDYWLFSFILKEKMSCLIKEKIFIDVDIQKVYNDIKENIKIRNTRDYVNNSFVVSYDLNVLEDIIQSFYVNSESIIYSNKKMGYTKRTLGLGSFNITFNGIDINPHMNDEFIYTTFSSSYVYIHSDQLISTYYLN